MISIVIPYYNRREILINTLKSFALDLPFKKYDFEVIIVDDASDETVDDLPELFPFKVTVFKYTKEQKWWTCPVIPINKGISLAKGEIIIIQCPESFHVGDIIKTASLIKDNQYFVFGCYALTKEQTERVMRGEYVEPLPQLFTHDEYGGWYQHTDYRRDCYDWCVAITRKDLIDLGGFDERYAGGIACGDADFIMRVRRKGMEVTEFDSPFVYHQMHPRAEYLPHAQDNDKLIEIAKKETTYRAKLSML